MRTLCAIALLLVLTFAGAAFAGQQAMIPCPELESGCVITCIEFDTLSSSFSSTSPALQVEFLDGGGNILATATLNALWGGQTRANLDQRVPADDVDSIRLYSADDSGSQVGWVALKVLCDPCACGCWNTVYKGCLCDWRATVEALPAPLEPEPAPVPAPEHPRLKRNPPKEVVQVPGRG